ncbi:MAG: glycosyltransferase family 4 protein [Phycisphaerae bacterium]|nr:glycosyltransferase family 4 protein [Phycisphaerae bacterium]
MPNTRRNVVAFISSYIPRHCGIATFTHDVATAVAKHAYHEPLDGSGNIRIVAINDRPQGYSYGPQVAFEIQQHVRADYRNAAEVLNTSKIDVVSLQHEFGLFGGEYGEHVLDLVDRLRVPLVSTCHTILADVPPKKLQILRHICKKSTMIVVMAEKAREILNEFYGVPMDRIRMIHHGVPDVPFSDPEPFKRRFDVAGRPTILTFGLLSPPKGIEFLLDALAKVVPDHPDLIYIILGETHPAVRRESGESYRLSLESRVVDLGIQDNVVFHNRYVSYSDMLEYLQASDIYVTPYPNKEQITSGSLAYALACGIATISTSYWHAQELLADGRGLLVEPGDVDGLAGALRELLDNEAKRTRLRKAAYEFSRQMLWPSVGRQYAEVIEEARSSFAERVREGILAPAVLAPAGGAGAGVREGILAPAAAIPRRRTLLRISLPDVRLDHLLNMTDSTGILHKAVHATPDRRHGYTTEDNARALTVAAMMWSIFQDERALPCMQTYLSFLQHAQSIEGGRFRNLMSYERRWLDPAGSGDCQGRVVWALGYLVSHAPNSPTQRAAETLFRCALPGIQQINSARPWAFAILGLHYYLRAHSDDQAAHDLLQDLASRLNTAFAEHETDEWQWYEDSVTYSNGRLPQALIIAGFMLDKHELVDRGLRVLRWLLGVQTTDTGHLSIIGNDGWFRRGIQRPVFNQQPLEPASLIGACKAAYRTSGDATWLREMRRCFEWYLGRNDLGTAMVDFRTWGCYDALMQSGLDFNQGAEALVSWLQALLTMHEMQTGDEMLVG